MKFCAHASSCLSVCVCVCVCVCVRACVRACVCVGGGRVGWEFPFSMTDAINRTEYGRIGKMSFTELKRIPSKILTQEL